MLTAWLIKKGFSLSGAQWIWRGVQLLAVVALFVAIYAKGFSDGEGRCTAKVNLALLQKEKSLNADLAKQRIENEQLTLQLVGLQQHERVVYHTIREMVPHVVSQSIYVPYPGSALECSVGDDYVRLWDDATFARMPDAAGDVADGSTAARAAEEEAPGFGELLTNHVDNAEVAQAVRTQCEGLRAFYREHRQ